MGIIHHTPDPAQGAIVDALNDIVLPDDNEDMKADNIQLGDQQLADWIAYLAKGPANDIDYKITGNGTPPIAGYTSLTNPIRLNGTGLQMNAPLDFVAGAEITGTVALTSNVVPGADPGANRLAAPSLLKAWAYIATDGSGGIDFAENYGITSITLTSTHFAITFSHAFASVKYALTATAQSDVPIARVYVCGGGPTSASTANIYVWNAVSSTLLDPTVSAMELAISANGRQV